jgi:hypothetical protein
MLIPSHLKWFTPHRRNLVGIRQHLNIPQVIGRSLGNGFQGLGRGFGFPVTMIAGEIGWQAITKIAKLQDATWTEGFGSRAIIAIIEHFE